MGAETLLYARSVAEAEANQGRLRDPATVDADLVNRFGSLAWSSSARLTRSFCRRCCRGEPDGPLQTTVVFGLVLQRFRSALSGTYRLSDMWYMDDGQRRMSPPAHHQKTTPDMKIDIGDGHRLDQLDGIISFLATRDDSEIPALVLDHGASTLSRCEAVAVGVVLQCLCSARQHDNQCLCKNSWHVHGWSERR